jgi:CBS domain-containing protein
MLAAMPTLGEVMTPDVLTVDPSDTIGEAAQKMTERGVGAVVVSDFGRMIGILTERDVMRAVAGRVHSSEARVREWMTPDPVTMTQDMSVEDAGRTMIERGFRHIPVVAEERAIGIVSIRDVAEWRLKESATPSR